MAKSNTFYQCSSCGYTCAKWLGKCPSCGEWDTLTEQKREEAAPAPAARHAAKSGKTVSATLLRDIPSLDSSRKKTGIGELDRVLGGGIVRGSVILAGGEPGIGKSTLFLQAADSLAKTSRVLYISGEESGEQVRMRYMRLGLSSDVAFISETALGNIISSARDHAPDFLIIDSIQTLYDPDLSSAPGSVSQVRECSAALARFAKETGTAVFLIGHVTKDGNLAGPRVLEHLVDTVLYFEGERSGAFRLLRAVKNRFGSTNEIGVFEMTGEGMVEVENPSSIMLSDEGKGSAGTCVFAALEGTRPVLLQVEALVSPTPFGLPRRQTTGVDYNRVSLIIAVLEKKIGLKLFDQDIFVNVSGGMKLSDPAMDMALAASIVSAYRNKPVRWGTVFMGEIGLTGTLRHTAQASRRAAEAARMGFDRVVLPKSNAKDISDMEVCAAATLSDALSFIF